MTKRSYPDEEKASALATNGVSPGSPPRRSASRARLSSSRLGRLRTKCAAHNRIHRLWCGSGKEQKATTHPHGLATRELVQGHDHPTVAELMGHRDGTMPAKVYGHLDRDTAHLKRALAD